MTFEPQILKQIVQEYLVEHPELLKNWVEEAIAKLYQQQEQQNIHQLPDNEMDIKEFKKKYAVKKVALKKLQLLWQSEAAAEDLIQSLKKG